MREAETNPSTEDRGVDLCNWPDSLIRAVAAEAPELIRQEMPEAYREGDLITFARGMAWVTHEVDEHFPYIDFDSYSTYLRDNCFRRFDADGQVWWVYDEGLAPAEGWIDVPKDVPTLDVSQWPDELIAAVAATYPSFLRDIDNESWAVAVDDFPQLAFAWFFEAGTGNALLRFVDLKRYEADERATFKEVKTASGKSYLLQRRIDRFSRCPDPYPLDLADPPDTWEMLRWPDALVTAVAARYPSVFRTESESIYALRDRDLTETISRWAEGHTEDVANAGGLEEWIGKVRDEQLLPFEVEGERWWLGAEWGEERRPALPAAV